MIDTGMVLHYLSNAARFGGRDDVPFDEEDQLWELGDEALVTGQLDVDVTREVLEAYASLCPDVPYGERPVPIVVCLRWFVPEDEAPRMPLLLMPGTLDVGGSLRPDVHASAWIPWRRFAADGTKADVPTVCALDAFRAHQEGMSDLPDDGSWRFAVERASATFDAVCGIESDANANGIVRSAPILMRIWESPDALASASSLLDVWARECDSDGPGCLTGPVRKLLGMPTTDEEGERGNDLPQDELLEPKLLCGIPDHMPTLGQGDKSALIAFTRQHDGDLIAMRAPKGTNSLAVSLAAMANHLTERALRGDAAPVMLCVAADTTLEGMESLLSSRPAAGQTALRSRWLPRIAAASDGSEARRILGPLPTICTTQLAVESARPESGSLVSRLGHPLMGDVITYAESWYVPQACTYFLDCASGFLGQRIRDVGDAAEMLSERLRRIDQDRCELIDAYANVCRAAELLKERDALLRKIGSLREDHKHTRDILRKWERLAQENPQPTRRAAMGRLDADQLDIISANALPEETLAQGCKLLSEVCTAYRKELRRIEEAIDLLRQTTTDLSRRARASVDDGQRCASTVARLHALCGLTMAQSQRLSATIDGRDVSMRRLDEILDQTVRPAEFWLAVHAYEARWLLLGQRGDVARNVLCGGGVVSWRAVANLCPVRLVSQNLAAAAMHDLVGTRGASAAPPADLVVALDADLLDVASGVAVLSGANRALVMGTTSSLGPQQPQGRTSDEVYAAKALGDAWPLVVEAGLSASGRSSLMRALITSDGVTRTSLYEGSGAYGELADLRSDLCPDEPLRTARIPSNSADDPSYPLLGIVPALSHVLVPDSSWQQVGASRTNRAEALALVRWLSKHGRQLHERYEAYDGVPIAVVSAYRAQTRLLSKTLADIKELPQDAIEIVALSDVGMRRWPVVLASATCGPAAYAGDCACDASSIMASLTACALDAIVLFWGGAWTKSDDPAALTYLRRATMVGRLYSVIRSGGLRKRPNPLTNPKHMDDETRRRLEVDLRAKPLSLTALLRKLVARGDLPLQPSTSAVNLALEQVGLIERVSDQGVHKGWRPTPAGREVGILGTTDRTGTPFCTYAPPSEAVVASTSLALLADE